MTVAEKKTQVLGARVVADMLDPAIAALMSTSAFPCQDKKEGSCITKLEDLCDKQGRHIFWYGADCEVARQKLCATCYALWLVSCARNSVMTLVRMGL